MQQTPCPAVTRYGDHLYIVIKYRPWRRWFRKTFVLRCWKCNEVRIEEP